MLRICCPYCGIRDEVEFHCGGDSHIVRPGPDGSDVAWSDYLFNRDNPKGVHTERWCHDFGCGQWFNMTRDTLTHEIYRIYRMADTAREVDS